MDMNMGSMSMGGIGDFQSTNIKIAHVFWYLVAATCLIRGTRKLVDRIQHILAKRNNTTRDAVPSRPTNLFSQFYQTNLATFREMSYPAMEPFKGKVTRFLTPPSLGQSLFILTFWAVILTMLFTDVFLKPSSNLYGYRWEKPGFRAAWVSITQIPLVYALSCKINIISIVTGVSYERLNWLHRWVARTLFLTVIVHWAYFFHEWTLADFVAYQLQMMPMVKYGFGAWALIGWSVIIGFGYFRHLRYELWVLQHLASAGILLWLLWVHVPVYARYNIWMAIGFIAFDRVLRGVWALARNLPRRSTRSGLGFRGQVIPLDHDYVRLLLKDVDFSWKAGQHVILSIPSCGLFQSHPFTIANNKVESASSSDSPNELEIMFKCHTGMTKRLRDKANAPWMPGPPRSEHGVFRVFVSGPWGNPPLTAIERSNTLVFISSSTGASYTMPLLEHAVRQASFVQHVRFYWIVRHHSQIAWFESRLQTAAQKLLELGVKDVKFQIFVTGTTLDMGSRNLSVDSAASSSSATSIHEDGTILPSHEKSDTVDVRKTSNALITEKSVTSSSASSSNVPSVVDEKASVPSDGIPIPIVSGRPASWDPLIRPAVESALGETVVVACGGKGLMAQVRTYVAALSDERAVHKGTGAQGIYFWGESYGW